MTTRRKATADKKAFTFDTYQNFLARVGIGTPNVAAAGSYQPTFTSRNRILLDNMYRSSWIVGQAVDCVAEDMTRAGVSIVSEADPKVGDAIHSAFQRLAIWQSITDTVKWARLYGGAVAVMLVDGQQSDTPLRADTIKKDQFKGLMVLDRWMVQPSQDEFITDFGPDMGMPKFYEIQSNNTKIPQLKVHHSRILRMDGVRLPYLIRTQENGWGMSVLERLFDRLTAFDSTTTGASQLVFQARLRIMYIDGLRQILATGGDVEKGLAKHIESIRQWQTNEGLTVLDGKDKFDIQSYTFTGLSDLLMQFGQQISGAVQIPLVRLFGQSPAGLNSTGESDMRNYYDGIAQQQEARLRRVLTTLIDLVARSDIGKPLPEDWSFFFRPLWQLKEEERAQVASTVTTMIEGAVESNLISRATGLRELRSISLSTGYYSNITSDDIKEAENDPPPGMPMMPGMEDPANMGAPPGPDDPMLEGQQENGFPGDRVSALDIHGIPVVIETARGEVRSGRGWSVTMPAHYGYIRGTSSAEGSDPGDQMDCYIGPNLSSQRVWIVYQKDPDTGKFDEHKVMFGYNEQEAALDDYIAAHDDGRDRIMKVERTNIDGLKKWLDRHWALARSVPYRINGMALPTQ